MPTLADSEALKVFATILKELKINFRFKLNDRRVLDQAIIVKTGCDKSLFNTICSSIDKLDKEPWEAVQKELIGKGIGQDKIDIIHQYILLQDDDNFKLMNKLREFLGSLPVFDEIELLFKNLQAMGIYQYFQFDTSLARGLDYYTGMIFEGIMIGDDGGHGIGSICGGGRYDNLIGMFGNRQIPSVGGSLGIERIFNILEMRAQKEKQVLNPTFAFVGSIGNISKSKIFEVVNWLWSAGIQAEVFYEDVSAKNQFTQAVTKNAKCFVLLGETELADNKVVMKDLRNKSQQMVNFSEKDLVEAVRNTFKE